MPVAPYAFHFDENGKMTPVKGLGEYGPTIVGDLLAIWHTEGWEYPDYRIDGMRGGMTPEGTFEKVVGAATCKNGTLLIYTQEYVDAHKDEEGWI